MTRAAIQTASRVDGDTVYFNFKCSCGAEGELGILASEGCKPFGCPEKCGNTYVPYRGIYREWLLRCVVEKVTA